ncbi:amidase [Evansella tamaricis]|uniref:Amidase n=1 Tax=Evansella tamaricis TaxID=2069301 RepID=A0ABS6JJR7_9BACI|nr:amidase [Evansella tamaricis]MBU9713907.1 amidase [Evansella tamaricis]
MKDVFNAFVRNDILLKPNRKGKLSSLTFAVKDVFQVKGIKGTAGNPDWLKTHPPAEKNASVIDLLLDNGATFVGTTITDELMYSLNGENFHYGTPINPKDPKRIPGGSSSGSAVAVSSGLVDFSLGTDTGGSVRIPAAYCGIFGFRPTHGLVPIDGVIPLAQSFDTVGWMAKDPNTLLRIGEVLLPNDLKKPTHVGAAFQTAKCPIESWELAEKGTKDVLSPVLSELEGVLTTVWEKISDHGLEEWSNVFKIIQGLEIWKNHGEWITKENPVFGPDIEARFKMASELELKKWGPNIGVRAEIREKVVNIIGDGILILPTIPGPAPKINGSKEDIESRRAKTMQLTCIAGLAGLPQVTLPVTNSPGVPLGLSVIAGPGNDLVLLHWVEEVWKRVMKRTG